MFTPSSRGPSLRTLPWLAALAALPLLASGCKDTTGTLQSVDVPGLAVHVPVDTLRLGKDTLPLSVSLSNAVGESVADTQVVWSISDSSILGLSGDTAVVYPVDTTYSLAPGDRGGVPDAPGPQVVTLTARARGAEGSIDLTAVTPVSWVNEQPDQACIVVQSRAGSSFDGLDAWVDARDFEGRIEHPDSVVWKVADGAVAELAFGQGDAGHVKVRGKAAGSTRIYAHPRGQSSLTDTLWLTVVDSSAVGQCPYGSGAVREGSGGVRGVGDARPE